MYFPWKPYVPAAARRRTVDQTVAKMQKKGQTLSPVAARRGAIVKSFWGKAWCRNLERYSDYSNRLPRGRTYLRNGSVIDLKIGPGEVTAQVMGSSLYRITVSIREVAGAHWQAITRDCARSIDTLVELLQGQLSTSVMERITRPGTGLFPSPKEIAFSCSCPDSAAMCKHVAATLYGIGARLDAEPELLFGLRKVDAKELIARAGESGTPVQNLPDAGRILDSSKLADVFGIDFGGVDPKPSHRLTAKKGKSVAPRKAKSASRVGKRWARGKSGK
ncbi:MAG: hypothetical protein WA642_21755 [Steroidobacteraceae bacterium]